MTRDARAAALLARAYAAHGSLDRWQRVERVSIELTAGGLIFWMKGVGPRMGTPFRAQVIPREQRTEIEPFARMPGHRGIFTPARRWIQRSDGTVVAETDRSPSRGLGAVTPWGTLGLLYFAGYALWNYFTLPFSLADERVAVEPVAPVSVGGRPCEGVLATYPPEIATHSPRERLYFGEDGLLVRHDYTAQVVAPGANGAHFSADYFEADGFRFAHRRRVYLRLGTFEFGPAVIWLDVHGGRVSVAA